MGNFGKVSICIDDLYAASKANHPAITKSDKNGKTYASVVVWHNEPNEWNNDISLQLSAPKDVDAPKVYIGNGRTAQAAAKAAPAPQAAATPHPANGYVDTGVGAR
jgi:hypothetical protein